MTNSDTAQSLKALDKAATPGTWGQYHPDIGPWKELAKNDIKNMDSSHHMSALIDGKPKRISEWTHADDAAFAEALVNAYRQSELVPAKVECKRYRHKKRGSEYAVIGEGLMQSNEWWSSLIIRDAERVDMQPVVIYQGDDGQIWVRPKGEFFDGRFEEVK